PRSCPPQAEVALGLGGEALGEHGLRRPTQTRRGLADGWAWSDPDGLDPRGGSDRAAGERAARSRARVEGVHAYLDGLGERRRRQRRRAGPSPAETTAPGPPSAARARVLVQSHEPGTGTSKRGPPPPHGLSWWCGCVPLVLSAVPAITGIPSALTATLRG